MRTAIRSHTDTANRFQNELEFTSGTGTRCTRHTTALRSCTLIMNNICINHGKTLQSAHDRRPRNAPRPGNNCFRRPGDGSKIKFGKTSTTAATCRIPDRLRPWLSVGFRGHVNGGAVGPTTSSTPSDHVHGPPPTGLPSVFGFVRHLVLGPVFFLRVRDLRRVTDTVSPTVRHTVRKLFRVSETISTRANTFLSVECSRPSNASINHKSDSTLSAFNTTLPV